MTKRGRLAGVLLDPEQYAELIERLDYLEDSLAALQARDERDAAQPWSEVPSGWHATTITASVTTGSCTLDDEHLVLIARIAHRREVYRR